MGHPDSPVGSAGSIHAGEASKVLVKIVILKLRV